MKPATRMVARLIPGTDPVHKVRLFRAAWRWALRFSFPRPTDIPMTGEHLLNNIAILLGGRAAEEIALQHMTTGAGNDLERATALARKMVL